MSGRARSAQPASGRLAGFLRARPRTLTTCGELATLLVMGTTEAEDWRMFIGTVAGMVYHLSGAAKDGTTAMPGYLELIKDWHRLRTENERLLTLMGGLAKFGLTVKQLAEMMKSMTDELSSKAVEIEELKRAKKLTEFELFVAQQDSAALRGDIESLRKELTSQVETSKSLDGELASQIRVAEALRAELASVTESLRRELAAKDEAAGLTDAAVLAVPWMREFQLVLHPRILQHVVDVLALSTSSGTATSIGEFVKAILRAVSAGTTTLEGSAQAILERLVNAGFIRPDKYSGRVLSWLVRRTPLVTRSTGSPVLYMVRLDWFVRPPSEILEHYRLRRPDATRLNADTR